MGEMGREREKYHLYLPQRRLSVDVTVFSHIRMMIDIFGLLLTRTSIVTLCRLGKEQIDAVIEDDG